MRLTSIKLPGDGSSYIGFERVPVGMLTDRDLTVAVVAKELDPRTLNVGDPMLPGRKR